jgi:hypothetical protein
MSRFVAIVCVCLFTTGCAPWGTHADSVTTCESGFAHDADWKRIARPGWYGRRIWREFPGFELGGATARPEKASTLWFRNEVKKEIGSCSMHSCESGTCVWRVRLFSKQSGGWQLRAGYDIGKVRARPVAH